MSFQEVAAAGAKITKLLTMATNGELNALLDPGELLGGVLSGYERNKLETPEDLARYLEQSRDIVDGLVELFDLLAVLPIWESETVTLFDMTKEGFEAWALDAQELVRRAENYSPDLEPPERPPEADSPDGAGGSNFSGAAAGSPGATPGRRGQSPPSVPGGPAACVLCGADTDNEVAGIAICDGCAAEAEQAAGLLLGGGDE